MKGYEPATRYSAQLAETIQAPAVLASDAPWVYKDYPCSLEVPNIPRHHRQSVDKRRGGNDCISFITAIWYMQVGATSSNNIIDYNCALSKLRANPAIHPCT